MTAIRVCLGLPGRPCHEQPLPPEVLINRLKQLREEML